MYIVKDVPLIPQQNDKACWYASAQMLIRWKQARKQATSKTVVDPAFVENLAKMHKNASGLHPVQMRAFAKQVGLVPVYPQSVSCEGIERMLRCYGPLWTHGQHHILVTVGANPEGDEVFVHDPWPEKKGAREWRAYSDWFINGESVDSRATDTAEVSFLYHP